MQRASIGALAVLLAALLACNASESRPPDEPGHAPPPPARRPIAQQEWTPPPASPNATNATSAAGTTSSGDAPEISRSVGVEGGVVVLWPRIVLPHNVPKPDDETRALASRAQARLADVARRALPGRAIDLRPEPERVCPKRGCKAMSVGILFARAGGGCSLVALVSAPGTSPQRLVQWSPGVVRINAQTVPFRSPPESAVKIDDYASCAKLPDDLAAKDADVEAAIKALAGS